MYLYIGMILLLCVLLFVLSLLFRKAKAEKICKMSAKTADHRKPCVSFWVYLYSKKRFLFFFLRSMAETLWIRCPL